MHTPSLFTTRPYYKPFDFPWAYDAFLASEQMHWLPREVPLNADVNDWKTRLTEDERGLLTQIFRFFTQADVQVAGAYIDRYMPMFKPTELRMMMSSIAAREGVHIQAYSMLIDEIGMPETEYAAFMEYEAMRDKHEYLSQPSEGLGGLARDIARFSAFSEGLQLFASFVILLNFTRFGKMKGMGQIIAWSIRDESHHVDSMLKVFHALLAERPELNTKELRMDIEDAARVMVHLEDRFIDLAFGEAEIQGLTKAEVKSYIRYIANRRLCQLGYADIYDEARNLDWVDFLVSGKEHTNFFENRPTDYAKATVTGDWGDAFGDDSAAEPVSAGQDINASATWSILSKPGCPYCVEAERVLDEHGHTFVSVNHASPSEIEEFKAMGHRTFPQVYRDGRLIGGYQDLRAHLGLPAEELQHS